MCPDKLTIQAVIDGEEKDGYAIKHIETCKHCQVIYADMQVLVSQAGMLKTEARLPEEFFKLLLDKPADKIAPVSYIAAALFILTVLSAYFTNPGIFQEWLAVGVTRSVSYFMDLYFDLFYFSQVLDTGLIIVVLTVVVLIEVLLLNKLRVMEGLR